MLEIQDIERKPNKQQIEYSTEAITLFCLILFKLKCVGVCCLSACLFGVCALAVCMKRPVMKSYAWLSPQSEILVIPSLQ